MASQAALKLTINTTTKQLWFSGSDVITTEVDGYFGWIGGNISQGNGIGMGLTGGLTSSVGTLNSTQDMVVFTSNGLAIFFGNTVAGTFTVTGNEAVKISYAILPAAERAAIDYMGTNQVPLTQNLGTGASAVNMEAVPEPSTYALLGLGAALMISQLRRRKA